MPNPTDGIIGYVCPAGHYCLAGAVIETPCDKGTYAPQTGLGRLSLLVCVRFKLVDLLVSNGIRNLAN